MNIVELKNHLEYLDLLIRQERTGTALDLAQRLNVSKRTIHNHFEQLRQIGFDIIYCPKKRTYKYAKTGSLKFGFY
jgi:predicted DNA-binding transcriptional regulator YafY